VRVLQCHPKEARHWSTTARGEGLFQPSILKDRPERSPSAVRDRVHPALAIMLDESPEGGCDFSWRVRLPVAAGMAYLSHMFYPSGWFTAQANRGKPAGHCEAHSPAGERHGGRASRGRGRHGNEGPGGATVGDDRKMNNEPLEREPIDRMRARLEARQTPLRDVAPAPNGRASLARVRPCRTGAASFMVARARGRARRRA
jgi:hypothetical protein